MVTTKPCYVIDGANFADFAGFVEECNRGFIQNLGGHWDGNPEAFAEYFGWREDHYLLIWKNSERSRNALALYFDFVLDVILKQPNVELRLE